MFDLYRAQDLIDQTEIYIKLFKINKTMIDLNQEAIDFEQSKLKEIGLTTSKTGAWSEGFIAGANSKYVQSESIKERKSLLNEIKIMFNLTSEDEKEVNRLIKKYEQQLNQLEDE